MCYIEMEQTLIMEADLWLRVFLTHSGRNFIRQFDGLTIHSDHYIGRIFLCNERFVKKRGSFAGNGTHLGGDKTPGKRSKDKKTKNRGKTNVDTDIPRISIKQ